MADSATMSAKEENEENIQNFLLPSIEETENHNMKERAGGGNCYSWKNGFKTVVSISLIFLCLRVLSMQKHVGNTSLEVSKWKFWPLLCTIDPSVCRRFPSVDGKLLRDDGSTTTTTKKRKKSPPRAPPPSSPSQCMDLDFDHNMDELLANTRQVYVLMPAKAAGSSMTQFTKKCMVRYPHLTNYIDRVSKLGPEESAKIQEDHLYNTLYVPPVISSHVKSDKGLIHLSQYPTRDSLIIYLHREETDRVVSAVKMVVSKACSLSFSETHSWLADIRANMFLNETHCIVDEGPLMTIIRHKTGEIGMGNVEGLTCNAYQALRDNGPNTVFMNFKSVDKLQKLIAKHHCPHLVEKPFHSNVDTDKPVQSVIRLRNEMQQEKHRTVTIEDWLWVKRPTMEWVFGTRGTASCQAKTHLMEDELSACGDQAMKITPATIRGWWENTRK